MKNLLKFATLALVLGLSATAHAHGTHWHPYPPPPDPGSPNTTPEVDPSLAIGGFALLGGSLTVLRSRRRR